MTKWFALPRPFWCWKHHCSFWGLYAHDCPQCKTLKAMASREITAPKDGAP